MTPEIRAGHAPSHAAPRGAAPIRRALLMGAATSLSVALLACYGLSAIDLLMPPRWYKVLAISILAAGAGLYVCIHSWRKQLEPRPQVVGRCADCGRELIAGQESCSLCGRKV